METFGDKLRRLESHPRFQAMTFEQQTASRGALMNKMLPLDPTFMKLSNDAKQQLYDQILSRPPVYEAGKNSTWIGPSQMLQKGEDPKFFDTTDADVLNQVFSGDKGAQTSLKRRGSMQLLYAMNTLHKFNLDSTLVQGLWKIGEPVVDAMYKAGLNGDMSIDVWKQTGRDRDKFIQYMDYQLNKDTRTRSTLQIYSTIAQLGAMTVDFDMAHKALWGTAELPSIMQGIGNAIAGLGKFKWVNALGSAIPRALEFWAPGVARAATSGAIGIIRENLHDIINEGAKDISFQQMSQNSLRYFSDYALFDIAFFGLGSSLKNLAKGAGRAIRGVKEGINPLDKLKGEIGRVASGLPVDEAWYSRMPEGVQNSIKAIESARITFANVTEATADDLFKTNAAFQGFLAEGAGEKWKVTSLVDSAKKAEFTTVKDSLKWMKKTSDALNWTPQTTNVLSSGQVGKNIVVSRMVKYNLPNATDDMVKTLPEAIAPVGGKFTGEGVEAFTQGFLKVGGIDDVTAKTFRAVEEGGQIKLFKGEQEIHSMSTNALSPKAETGGISGLIESIKKVTPEVGKLEAPMIAEQYTAALKKRPMYTASWVKDVVETEGGKFIQNADGGFQVELRGKTFNVSKPEDFGDTLVQTLIGNNKEMLKTHLNYYENLKLIERPEGFAIGVPSKPRTITRPEEGVIWKNTSKRITEWYKTVPELLQAHPEFTPKIPAQFGPKMTLVTGDWKDGILMKRNVFSGTEADILTELSKFKDLESKYTIPFKIGDATVQYDSMVYHVDMPHLGYRESFGSMGEVKEFLSHDLYTQLRKVGTTKGFVLDRFDGKYFISSGTGEVRQIWTAKNLDEVANIFSQKALMPEWAPELTGIDARLAKTLKKLPGFQRKPLSFELKPNTEGLTSWQTVEQFFRVPDAYFSDMAKGAGKKVTAYGAREIAGMYREIEDGLDVAQGFLKKDCDVLDSLFQLSNGKKMKSSQRIIVQELLETPKENWGKFFEENTAGLKLKPSDIEDLKTVADNVRKFLGESKTKGLFATMGNDPEKFLTEYYPRMREHALRYNKSYVPSDVAGLLRDIHGGNIPRDQIAFFKHARTSEMVTFAREKDPLIVLQKYLSTGYREQFVGPVIEKFNKWAAVNASKVDPSLMKRFGTYLGDIAGIPNSLSESMMIDTTQKLFKELKIGDKVFARNLIDSITGMTYLGTLGFRPYPIFRNSLQMFQMLAPRLGSNGWVFRAMKTVAEDKAGTIMKSLEAKGIIGSVIPVHGGEAFKGADLMSKLTEKGLGAYRSVDDYGRAVAYTAASDMFNDALQRFEANKITQKQFVHDAGLTRLAPEREAQALDLIAAGKIDGARDLFARDIVMETMIPYRSGTNPLMFRGVVGKLFGQMGHFPAYYVENIRRGLTRGNFGDKIKFALTATGNGLAITGALAMLGIKDESYLPWSQTIFTGGPWWDLMQKGLTSFEQTPEGAQARAQMFGIVKADGGLGFRFDAKKFMNSPIHNNFTFIPRGEIKGIIDAGNHLNNGDYYKFFLALASTPGSLRD